MSAAVVEGVAIAAIGTCLGSFAGLVADRLPRDEAWLGGRSRCGGCGTHLRARDLVPVVSWIAARGRCRHCGGTIPIRDLGVEVASGAALLAAWMVFGPTWPLVCAAALMIALVVIVAVDLTWLIVPDEMVALAALAGVGWRAATDQAWLMAAGTALGLAGMALALRWIFTRRRGVEALGLGDVKLMAVAGLWLPLGALGWFLAAAGTGGLVLGLAWRGWGGGPQFPFGPGLAVGLYGVVLGLGAGAIPWSTG